MLADDETALRGFCARLLGWSEERAQDIEHALRSIHLAITHRAALVLLGDTDPVPIAQALHRRTLGADRPFVVCDPRRLDVPASVRFPMNHERGPAAFQAARGGTLCVRRRRAPHDFSSLLALVRSPTADVQLVICAAASFYADPLLALPVPIRVPPLGERASELPRIVDEYALDALGALGADAACFADADRAWVLERAASTLPAIETATLRLVALRMSPSVHRAAERLGISSVALGQWLSRRRVPPARWLHAASAHARPRPDDASAPRSR